MAAFIWLAVGLVSLALTVQGTPYTQAQCQGNRHVTVHLFEWSWTDIANECESYLGPKGFCAVQVSPPMEHIQGSQWWTRYQPVSYLLESRSGTRDQFIDMVERCAAVGVNIYVDAVMNHMSGNDRTGVGSGGSQFNGDSQDYPDFSSSNFHQPYCPINNYGDPDQVRNCYLVGLNDLDGAQTYVQDVQAKYMNDLISIGVAGFRVDAAKHMWPADIEALQAKLNDLPSGGRPFFYMEVIDQGGEPIKVDEYYETGQVTEFRYCIKVGEGVKNGFFNLPDPNDPGMCDNEHAYVFVDNHDNQRGHGGGGNILTHKDPTNYRYAVAFTLAQNYGTKRIMSSYYFGDDSDQGPPQTSPGCGNEWVCEHRWKSIGQMVEFTNAVAGEPIEYRVAEQSTLALSRGSKGFFAMGNLNQDFETGLPDGEYCDIISECQQKIQISGGKGHFQVYDSNEPVVAICQGCTGKEENDPATTTAATMTTTSGHTPVPPNDNCCQKITLSSQGGVQVHYSEALGDYAVESTDDNGKPIFRHKTNLISVYLHHTSDQEHNWSGWQFTRDVSDVFGFISNENEDSCPSGTKNEAWKYHLNGQWFEDDTVKVECSDDGDTTTTVHPTDPTTSGTTTVKTTTPSGPTTPHDKCAVSDSDKIDCGKFGTSQLQCESNDCCWEPVEPNPTNLPWCFQTTDYEDPCGDFVWTADGPGFTDEFYNIMFENYKANLNIDGSGAVVAAPDQSTPGGSYYYHWMRDAGLSIKAWIDINDNDYDKIQEVLSAFTKWVKVVQNKPDPNDIDVRIEPKFEIPSGDPYTGGWCRPQTDGPALRAMAMSKWGMVLNNAGQSSVAKSEVWPLVSFDMEWVLANWESEGCDLWEEVRSDNFYFNRAGFIYSLNVAADFADMIGESEGSQYRSKADEILEATKDHYGKFGDYIYECDVRPQDGAVIHSIATFGEYIYGPSSNEAAATIAQLTKSFCREYKINQDAIVEGKSGIVIGRYPGDHYAGGNPWQLLTAVLGETFYLGAQATLKSIEDKGVADFALDEEESREWIKLLDTYESGNLKTALDLALAQKSAGDSVMYRLWEHVKDDGGRIDEQIDRNTGVQASAEGLTWSYANILHSLHVREQLIQSMKKHNLE